MIMLRSLTALDTRVGGIKKKNSGNIWLFNFFIIYLYRNYEIRFDWLPCYGGIRVDNVCGWN